MCYKVSKHNFICKIDLSLCLCICLSVYLSIWAWNKTLLDLERILLTLFVDLALSHSLLVIAKTFFKHKYFFIFNLKNLAEPVYR